jgi:signal transduction histidine kinase
MPRNKEMLIYAAIAFAITLISVSLCFTVNKNAGIICLAGCLCIIGICIFFTMRRYRKISELCLYLQKITRGETALDIRDNTEGELSILKNEIYKVATALTGQAKLLKKDKTELSNALSDISHQLKTPLTSMNIMIDLLADENLPDEKKNEFLDSIRAGLDRMEWLVLTLLKLARLDAGAVPLKKNDVLLSSLIEKSLVPMLIPMEIKNQSYSVQGEDINIFCDFDWTVEAIGNIIKNAVENTPENGKIEILYGANPIYSYITVHDGGPGISKNDMPHLFKRFYRGYNTGRDSAGIGLAMSLAIMRKQNGDIEAANDNGGVFTLKFYK